MKNTLAGLMMKNYGIIYGITRRQSLYFWYTRLQNTINFYVWINMVGAFLYIIGWKYVFDSYKLSFLIYFSSKQFMWHTARTITNNQNLCHIVFVIVNVSHWVCWVKHLIKYDITLMKWFWYHLWIQILSLVINTTRLCAISPTFFPSQRAQ